MSQPAILREGHSVQLLRGGGEFFPALLQAIAQSQHEVRLETYIFEFDASGEQVADALLQAARRGVRVTLLMDGFGTDRVPPDWAARWDDAGLAWQMYAPLGRWGLLLPGNWRRLHRKLCVVDCEVAFCGGINVLDDLHDPTWGAQQSPRFDFAVRVVGPVVAEVHHAMAQLWQRWQAGRQMQRMQFRKARRTLREAVPGIAAGAKNHAVPADADVRVAFVQRDNVHNRRRIERTYLKAFAEAQHEIIVANAYFVPGRKLRKSLLHAARRGVRVLLLVQGRYEYFMQFHAARPALAPLVLAGVEVHEYQPGFLHAKVAVVDGVWATVGSSNLDPLSLLLAREANVVVADKAFAGALRASLLAVLPADVQRLDAAALARRTLWQRLLDRLAFGLMRTMLFLSGRRY